jgi:hypothetical protein
MVKVVPFRDKDGSLHLLRRSAKSCEPEGAQMKCGGTPSAQAC